MPTPAADRLSCRQVADFLYDYLESALPLSVRVAFEQHLAVCAACRAYLASYTATVTLARRLGQPVPDEWLEPVPEDLVAAVLSAWAAGRS